MNAPVVLPYVVEPLAVVKRHWLNGFDSDPPCIELTLSNGSMCKVGYDSDYHHVLLWTSPDSEEDYRSATVAETGLHPDILAPIAEEAEQAVRAWDRDREEGTPPKYSYADRCFGGGN
jgi:hypothetical protein